MNDERSGFTLIESLFALIILIGIIVPLATFLYKQNGAVQARRSITATCLLEQEAALAVCFPEDVAPVKHRPLAGKEWTIRTEASGTDPLLYKMTALENGCVVDSVVFYGRKGK